jgi:protein O-mannosyl-transferase
MASAGTRRRESRRQAVATASGNTQITIWMPVAALALAAIAFSPAINGSLVFDDRHLPFADPNAGRMPAGFWIGGVRPVLMATYWANYLLSGTRTFSYHAVNVALHVCAAILVFNILKRLISISGMTVSSQWAGLFGAAVFLVHPLQAESVDYIAGRSEILCTVFVLAGWLVLLRHFEANTTWDRAIQILACAAAAVLSKESGVCLVLLLAATDFYWRHGSAAAQFRKRVALYVPFLLGSGAAAALILRELAHSTTAGFAAGADPLSYALTECRVILLYIRLFLVPAGQNADWQIPLNHSPGDGHAWVFLLGITVLIAAIAWLYNRARAVSFGLLVFLLALLPTSSFVPVRDVMAERRMYLPLVGLIFALIGLADKLRPRSRLTGPAAIAALLALTAASYRRSEIWSNDKLLWKDAIERNSGDARAHAGLGASLLTSHDCPGAVREFRIVVDLQGLDDIDGRNLGAAYECTKQTNLAIDTYRRVVKTHPVSEVYTRIGYLEALRDNGPAAYAAVNEALRLNPHNAPAYTLRGVVKIAAGDTAGARDDFAQALGIDPGNALATSWMAKLSRETPGAVSRK